MKFLLFLWWQDIGNTPTSVCQKTTKTTSNNVFIYVSLFFDELQLQNNLFQFFFLTEEKYSSSWTSKCVSWQYCSCQWTKSASWFHRYIAISDKANQAIWSTAQYHINLHLQIGFLPQSRVVRKWSVLMAKSTNMLM